MSELLASFVREGREYSLLEIAAVLLAIAYLVLAIRQNIWCWLCAALSTAIYTWLMFDVQLYMESLLNVFYFGMAVYGWQAWTRGTAGDAHVPVTRWPLPAHLAALVLLLVASAASGYLLDMRTAAAWPYVDSATTWSSIWATYLVARKVLENWWYWLVIDLVSMLLYWDRELKLTALLFAVYLVMIPFGYLSWRKSMRDCR